MKRSSTIRRRLLLTTRVTEETSYIEKRNSFSFDYVSYFENLGYLIVPMPANTGHPADYLLLTPDAIVLTGGNTIDPAWFEQDRLASQLTGVFPERDLAEKRLLQSAIKQRIPVLGICRGMQLINCFFGGQVHYSETGHVGCDHQLMSTQLPMLNGQNTNSYHEDVICESDVARELSVIAKSIDGTIEAIHHPQLPILGVQWHPERQQRSFDSILITQFLKRGKIP